MTSSPEQPTDETRARRYLVPATTAASEHLLEIKRSEFIGHILRVESEAQAREYIDSLRKTYHDARHVCSAFVIGADRQIQRSSDDGEPAGTAGIPMLQAVLNHRRPLPDGDGEAELSDVCAVVVRYFGGIKLGAGGLVRAYTDAVVQTLERTPLALRSRLRLGSIPVAHADAGRLENELRAEGTTVLGTDYAAEHAVLRIAVADDDAAVASAEERLAALTAGSARPEWGGTDWVDTPLP